MSVEAVDQGSRAHARHEDHDIDLTGDEAVGEINRLALIHQLDFAHRWTHGRHTAKALDQARQLIGTTAFERGDSQSAKAGILAICHGLVVLLNLAVISDRTGKKAMLSHPCETQKR